MLEDPGALLTVAGGVSGVGGLLGSIIGNRVNLEWIKERLQEHNGKLKAHEQFIQAHELELALIKKGGSHGLVKESR